MNPTYVIENTFRPSQFTATMTVGNQGAIVTSKGPDILTIAIVLVIVLTIVGGTLWYLNEEAKKAEEGTLEFQF